DLRWTSQARFHLEVGFIKLAKIRHLRDIEEVLRELNDRTPQVGNEKLQPRKLAAEPKGPTEQQHQVSGVENSPSGQSASTFADVFNRRVEDKSATTAVYTQKAERIERSGDLVRIVITNPTQLALLQSKEHKAVLDTVASELVGKAVSVSLIMKEQQQN